MYYLLERIEKICSEIEKYIYREKVVIDNFRIVEGKYDYLNNYIANINKNGGKGNSHANVLSFSTPIGRAMAVNDNKTDAAFVSSMFYPIILICILVIAIMIYLLYRYL